MWLLNLIFWLFMLLLSVSALITIFIFITLAFIGLCPLIPVYLIFLMIAGKE